ncbi:ABC transporter permease [Evansella cellulosilytica]|uniref:ABC-2 family transporter protein n=1 Tax=Evansella cellulosilytica (strain ATCC 21833 / DSM 2522 / FERM P-1141 / JCM 9156 / N-4) TaxID=649639 RepID=E6TRW0_EVAC2|nr:ABC transporter permease [Evansella cellulosilytica]ADU29483.1 hypothetical protein Bcell_1218 [Evansella cellulosilytica DSM 2522]
MYKHECFKIFTKKSIYVVFFFIVLLLLFANSRSLDWVMKDEVYGELYEIFGGPVTEELDSIVREEMVAEDAGERQGGTPASEVNFLVARSALYLGQLEERKDILDEKMATLQASTYEYKVASKELTMLEELKNPHGFYRIQSWNGTLDLIEPFFSVVLIALLVLVGLSPVFSDEHLHKMTGLILATRHGKREVVTAKLLASMTYIGVIFLLLHVINLVSQFIIYGGFKGWYAPIQSLLTFPADYAFSPYAWEVWQFYIITLSVQFLGATALGILVLLLSVITKNAMITFFLSGSILGLPFALRQVGLDHGWLETFNLFSYLELLRVERLFDSFKAYNVFGNPVLFPTLIITVYTVLTLILLWILYYRFKNQQVSE